MGRFYFLSIFDSSIYLTRGGFVYLGTGALRYAARISHYWMSTATQSLLESYYLHVDINIYPSRSNERYYGFMVRIKHLLIFLYI